MRIADPPALKANFVYNGDEVLRARVEPYSRRYPGLEVTFSKQPLPLQEVALYIIDVSRLDDVLPPGGRMDKADVRVVCYGPPEELSTAWEGGCADYLKDPWTIGELHFRLEKLLFAGGRTVEMGGIALNGIQLACGDTRRRLSAQEAKILALLLSHPSAVVPREALYYGIWGKAGTGSRVVDMHVSRLRRKLMSIQRSVPPHERIEIKTARGEGYVVS